jgi:sirohydrochlorin cobaltochelatase
VDWFEFVQSKGGLLVVGHGTRRADGTAQLLQLGLQMQSQLPSVPMEACFLELATPSIAQGLAKLKERGVHSVVVVPILLFKAGHAKSDIPEAVESSAAELGLKIIAQTDSLETHPSIVALSKKRFDEAVRCTNPNGCLRAGGCEVRDECFKNMSTTSYSQKLEDKFRFGLAIVGRGASDESAIESMRRFSELRYVASGAKPAWSKTGFFVGGRPTVDELLDEAEQADLDVLVVQPHLLFEGELLNQLRAKVDARRTASLLLGDSNRQAFAEVKSSSPQPPDSGRFNKCRLVTMPLGADEGLAEIFVALAAEKLREIPTNGDV